MKTSSKCKQFVEEQNLHNYKNNQTLESFRIDRFQHSEYRQLKVINHTLQKEKWKQKDNMIHLLHAIQAEFRASASPVYKNQLSNNIVRLDDTVPPKLSITYARKGKKIHFPETCILQHIPQRLYTHTQVCIQTRNIHRHTPLYVYIPKNLNRICWTAEGRSMEKHFDMVTISTT